MLFFENCNESEKQDLENIIRSSQNRNLHSESDFNKLFVKRNWVANFLCGVKVAFKFKHRTFRLPIIAGLGK